MKTILITISTLSMLLLMLSCNNLNDPQNVDLRLEIIKENNTVNSHLVTGWYYINDNEEGIKRKLDKTEEYYYVNPKPIVIQKYFDKVEIYKTDDFKEKTGNTEALSIIIHRNYEYLWGDATEKAAGRRLGFIINNKLVNAPKVTFRIEGGVSSVNRGVYTKEELESFIEQINNAH